MTGTSGQINLTQLSWEKNIWGIMEATIKFPNSNKFNLNENKEKI